MGSLFLVQVARASEAVKIWLEQTIYKKVFLSQPTSMTTKMFLDNIVRAKITIMHKLRNSQNPFVTYWKH